MWFLHLFGSTLEGRLRHVRFLFLSPFRAPSPFQKKALFIAATGFLMKLTIT
jgi:hypothetical protein